MLRRTRKSWSIKEELLVKSRESMLSAVQIFNNPSIAFKAEIFIVLANIAWTYLMHAYYRSKNIEYRYHRVINTRKRFERTKKGAFKFWELEKCLDSELSPVDKISKINLKFLIGLRHEIEHQMTHKIDDYLSARFQACCLNYNLLIKESFGQSYGIDQHLSFSLQFSTITEGHANQLKQFSDLPPNISAYINHFDESVDERDFNDIRYSYRVLYVPKLVNKKGQADKVVEFVKTDTPEAESLNREYVLIKEREKQKFLPTEIWKKMVENGFNKFGPYQHTRLWQSLEAKAEGKGFGTQVAKQWYWYDTWFKEVEKHCVNNSELYK